MAALNDEEDGDFDESRDDLGDAFASAEPDETAGETAPMEADPEGGAEDLAGQIDEDEAASQGAGRDEEPDNVEEPEAEDGGDAEEEEKDIDEEPPPAKPRRALSAWGSFLAAKFNGAISKKAAEEWKALDEEVRAEFTETAATDKARFDEEKVVYVAAYEAWSVAHPVAAKRLAANGSLKSGSAALSLEAGVPYLPVSKVRRMTRIAGAKAFSKEGLFTIIKASEQLVTMLTEQTVASARKGKRKSVMPSDLAAVLYGARCADLVQFCHPDLPQAALLAAVPAKTRKPSATKADRAGERAERRAGRKKQRLADDQDFGDEDENEDDDNGKKSTKGRKGKPEMPVQSTTMRNFFSARPMGEPAPPPPADAAFKGADQEDEDMDDLEDMKAAMYADESDEDDDGGEDVDDEEEDAVVQQAAPRRRRAILDEDEDDEEEEEEEEEEDDEGETAGAEEHTMDAGDAEIDNPDAESDDDAEES